MAINLGDINFGLGPDTRRLDRARQSVIQFGQAVNRAAQSQAEGARQAEAAMRRQEKAILSALQTTLKLNDSIRQAGASGRLIQTTTNSFNRLVKELGSGQVSALQFQRSMEDFQASTGRVNRALSAHRSEMRQNEKAQRDLEKAMRDAARTQERQATLSTKLAFEAARAQEQGILRQERALHSAQLAVDRYNAAVSRLKTTQQGAFAGRADNALNVLRTQLNSAGNSMIQFQRAQQTFQRSMAGLNNELGAFRSRANQAAQTGLEAALRRLADVSILLHGPLSGVATRLVLISSLSESVSLGMAALVTGVSAGAYAFYQLGRGAVDAARQMDKIDQTLTALHGSSVISQIDMEYLMTLADRAGAQFETTARQYARLTAASQGTNLEGERTRQIFENILFASQKLGSSNEELAGTLRAVEQIMSKGQVQAEELRGQLGDRLPGAVNIMAEALGVSTQELNKMMEQGQLTSDVLVAFADTLAKRLGVDTAEAIDNVTAAENRLVNAFLRFRTAVDESIGFSDAYKAVLNGLVGTLDWLADNVNNVARVIGAASGAILGALAAIYAPAIISGFTSLITLVRTLTTVMWGLTAAIVANPMGALVTTLIRVGAAALGAVAGFELMNAAIGDTDRAQRGALPAVEDYIAAQRNLKTSIRETTQEYIRQQEVLLQGLRAQLPEMERAAQAAEDWIDKYSPHLRQYMDNDDFINNPLVQRSLQGPSLNAIKSYRDLQEQISHAEENLRELHDIMTRQTAEENARTEAVKRGTQATNESSASMDRMALAIKRANDTITETQEELRILFMPKWQQAWARVQLDINRSIEDFRDQLIKAKVPAGEVAALTERYAAAIRSLKEGEFILQTQTTLWEALATTLGNSMDQAMNTMVDGIIEGKNALELLRDVGISVATDLIKTFLQLAAINPLKNLLFGVNPATGMAWPTLVGGPGGGLLGSLIGGLGGFLGLPGAANGMAFTEGSRRFRQGGVFSSPTMFNTPTGPILGGEAGPEALMPLTRNSRGELSVKAYGAAQTVNFYVSTPDVQSFKKSESQLAAMVARVGQRGMRNN